MVFSWARTKPEICGSVYIFPPSITAHSPLGPGTMS